MKNPLAHRSGIEMMAAMIESMRRSPVLCACGWRGRRLVYGPVMGRVVATDEKVELMPVAVLDSDLPCPRCGGQTVIAA